MNFFKKGFLTTQVLLFPGFTPPVGITYRSSLVYTIGGGKCGQCLVQDRIIAASGGKAGTKGTCFSQGYTVAAGSTPVTVPNQGKLDCAVFTKKPVVWATSTVYTIGSSPPPIFCLARETM